MNERLKIDNDDDWILAERVRKMLDDYDASGLEDIINKFAASVGEAKNLHQIRNAIEDFASAAATEDDLGQEIVRQGAILALQGHPDILFPEAVVDVALKDANQKYE